MEGGRGGGGRSREDKGGWGTQPHSLGQLDVSLVVTCLSSQLERDTQKQEKFMWLWVLEAGRGTGSWCLVGFLLPMVGTGGEATGAERGLSSACQQWRLR